MEKIYYVQNRRTREILNQKGAWSKGIKSYRVATFDTEDDAKAAFPQGVDCQVLPGWKKPAKTLPAVLAAVAGKKLGAIGSGKKVCIQKGNRYLCADDTFSSRSRNCETTALFDSEDAALDKAEALGLDLDRIHVCKASGKPAAVDDQSKPKG
jgi:hypothetical protein